MNTLWFVTSRTCNLACGYCYQGQDNHERDYLVPRGLAPIMSKSVADKALPWALDWAPPKTGVKLVFYGGEPTLAWPLIEAVVPEWRAAFEEIAVPIAFSITSNGTMLTESRRAFMDEHKIGLLLSLDGPRDVHDQSRPAKNGNGSSWDLIQPQELLEWKPQLEVAWAVSPSGRWSPEALDQMVHMGFRRINFNLDFSSDWSVEDAARLQAFGQHAGRLVATGQIQSNWEKKYIKAGTGTRMERPCGTNAHGMLALTPEGDLYPSQEMAFTVYEPGRPANTPDYYRVGNVEDGLDPNAVARVSLLSVDDMKPPAGYDCSDCVATAACIGGCHCRYVGQNDDAAQRHEIPAGQCASMRAFLTGFMAGFWIERKLTPTAKGKPKTCAPKPATPTDFPDVATLDFRR